LWFEAGRARPYLKIIYHKKRAGGVAHGIGPEFKPQHRKKKKKKKKKNQTPKKK
jgi:hypothetical protein